MPLFKSTALVQWEFQFEGSQEKALKSALEHLEKFLPEDISFRLKIKESKSKRRTVLGEFPPEDVFPYVSSENIIREYKIGKNKYKVRMNSQRYYVFQKSLSCVSCGIKGNKFLLEQYSTDRNPHFNFYAERNGQLILMTKDHIVAKSNGGSNKLENYQTMCSVCNNLKGNLPLSIKDVAVLKKLFDENKRILTRRELNILLDETREKLLNL
jgi:5-methylcytosine-specific restriction endonuclease McrA